MEPLVRAAIYCRVSTEEQAREGFSIAAQKKILAAFCESRSWNIVKEYVDEGISGKSTRRPAFQELLRDAKNKKFDAVLVWKINRLSRKNADLLNTAETLREHDVSLLSCSEQFDSSTPAGKLMLSMLGSIGEFERDTMIENIKAGMNERARQGMFNGGRLLGYDVKNGRLSINAKEASTIRRIYELYLSGFSLSCIRNILAKEARMTKRGYAFEISTIKRILLNPVYSGYISYNKTSRSVKQESPILVHGYHEPLVSAEQFEAVKRRINLKIRSYVRKNNFILSSILRCPECGGKMTGNTIGKYRYYVCLDYKNNGKKSCSSNTIDASTAESLILNCIFPYFASPTIVDDVYIKIQELKNKNNEAAVIESWWIENEITFLKSAVSKYLRLFEDNCSYIEILSDRIREINEKILVLKERYTILIQGNKNFCMDRNKVQGKIKGFSNLFYSLDTAERKSILSSIIKDTCISKEKTVKYINFNFPHLAENCGCYSSDHVKCDIDT